MTIEKTTSTINKKILVALVRKKTCLPNHIVNEIITTTLETIKNELSLGNSIQLLNFGKWKLIRVAEKKIKTTIISIGEKISPSHNRVKFTPSEQFKKQVR